MARHVGRGELKLEAAVIRFGLPARLPAPGERRRKEAAIPRSRARTPGTALAGWFAVAAPGLEEAVAAEVAALPGVTGVARVVGGVAFSGPLETGMSANLTLRVATRVLLRLGEVEARTFPELRRRLRALPWRETLVAASGLRVEAAASRCRLYHTGALAETMTLAIGDHLGSVARSAPARGGEQPPAQAGRATEAASADGNADTDPDADNAARVFIRGRDDRFTISVDSSGELLHRRGWRVETGQAPLRETLAAGLLWLAGYDPAVPFVDPMCGAGTIALEACARALGVAPGLARSFAFERWPIFDPATWDRLRDQALAAIRSAPPAAVFAFDRDPEAVEITRRNAARAGLLPHLTVEQVALGERRAPEERGLLVVNPPYGRRLPGAGIARDLRRALHADYAGWRVAMLAPPGRAVQTIGVRSAVSHRLSNGGVRVELAIAELPARRTEGSSSTPASALARPSRGG
jgi:putative N6-adenine-specific DNA methylase